MEQERKISPAKINPVVGIITATLVTALGMVSVFVAGNARGYDPSLAVLVRNALLMCVFLLIYMILKPRYKGDFAILVVVAFLTGIGFIIQYRISSAINVDFQKTLVSQYAAAALKQVGEGAQAVDGVDSTSVSVTSPEEEGTLGSIEQEGKELLKLERLKFNQLVQEFIDSVPGWSRFILSFLIALLSIVYIVRKCSENRFMDSLSKPFFWVTLTVFFLIIFVVLSEVKTRGRFVYQMTPWEIFKITIIIFLAGFFAKYKEDFTKKVPRIRGKRLKSLLLPWGPFIMIWLVPQLLFVLLKDFGQVVLYGGLVIIMIFVTTRKYIYLLGGIAVTYFASKSILLFEGIFPPHVLKRFVIWSNIWALPHDGAWWDRVYQIMNSFFALNAGGWTGSGLGLGYPTNIPLVVSDFVYSAIAEELGFLGCAVIVLLYLVLIFLGMRIVADCDDDFERLLAVGFTAMIGIQAFVNIGGVTKLIPLTGITLPFISRGGFSIIISFIMIGFLMGLSHRNGSTRQ